MRSRSDTIQIDGDRGALRECVKVPDRLPDRTGVRGDVARQDQSGIAGKHLLKDNRGFERQTEILLQTAGTAVGENAAAVKGQRMKPFLEAFGMNARQRRGAEQFFLRIRSDVGQVGDVDVRPVSGERVVIVCERRDVRQRRG